MIELLLVFGVIALLTRLHSQHNRLTDLEQRLGTLERLLETRSERLVSETVTDEPAPERPHGVAPPAPAAPPGRTAPSAPHRPAAAPLPPLAQAILTVPPPPSPPAVPPPPSAPPPSARRWQGLDRLLIANWSGILGVLVLVAGVTFVAINVALRLGAFERFLLLAAAAAALALPSVVIGRREPWRDLSDWMRSGGAALFLFACTAAGGLPGLGLQWIQEPRAALGLICLGMLANLALAGIARTQTIASLHVVVALVPLLIVPQSGLTLAIASVVALVGLGLPQGRGWNRHLLLVTLAYAAYHAFWFLRCQALLEGGGPLRAVAALAALLVFGGGALLQQVPPAVAPRLQPLPLALQLSNGGALALALLIYPQQPPLRAAALAGAAVVGLLLGQRARRRGWRWLHRSNALLAQAFALAALASLHPVIANPPLLLFSLLFECVLFLGITALEGERTLCRIGSALTALAAVALALVALNEAAGYRSMAAALQDSGVLIGGALLTSGAQALAERRRLAVPLSPLLGWLAPALAVVGACVAPALIWRPALGLLVIGGLLLLARRLRPPGLLAGSALAVVLLHARDWVWLLAHQPLTPALLLSHLLPLLGLALVLIAAACGDSPQRNLGIDLLGLDAGLGAFLLLDPISPLLPGVAWLMLALIALEVADRLRRSAALHGLGLGTAYLGAFAAAYLLVINQSPASVSLGSFSVRGRLLIELFAIAVALYWCLFRGGPTLAGLGLWRAIQPCFLELALLGVSLTLLTEITVLWRPLAWSLLALLLISQPLRRLFAVRLQVYAVIVYWVAVATLVAMLSTLEFPSPHWFAQPQWIALAAIALQTLFIVASHRWLDLEPLRRPGGLAPLAWLGRRLADHRNPWLYLPMFVAVAWYLAVRYDHSLLTLLWTAEAFGIYVLSALLQENQFRYLALLAMGGCLLRLLAIDMAQADLGLRGLVFIGVGLLMLAMNAIYNRFRSRFQ